MDIGHQILNIEKIDVLCENSPAAEAFSPYRFVERRTEDYGNKKIGRSIGWTYAARNLYNSSNSPREEGVMAREALLPDLP